MKKTILISTKLLAFVGLTFLILLFQRSQINIYDESIILAGALQMQNGLYPGIDFYTVYGPLQYWLAALVFDLFGNNVIYGRLLHAVFVSITILALTSLLRPTESKERAALASLLAVVIIVFNSKFPYPLYPGHTIGSICAFFVFIIIKQKGYYSIVQFTSIILFIAAIFLLRPVLGFLILAGLYCSVPFECLNRNDFFVSKILKSYVYLTLCAVFSACIIFAFDSLTRGSFQATLSLLLDTQMPAYRENRVLPFPSIGSEFDPLIFAYLPVVAVLTCGVLYLYTLVRREYFSKDFQSQLFWLIFFCIGLYSMALIRTSNIHLWPSFMFAITMIICTIAELKLKPSKFPKKSKAFFIITASLSLLIFIGFSNKYIQHKLIIANSCKVANLFVDTASCLTLGPERQGVVETLDQILAREEKFFSTNTRHDLIFINNMAYYFILGRLPITYWAQMEPGIQTTKKIQKQIISDLDAYIIENGRAIVVLEPFKFQNEPNKSSISSKEKALDKYLLGCDILQRIEQVEILSCNTPSFHKD